jgi:amino acid transporter
VTISTQTGDRPAARFGAFGGVFTPCTLTILGVIMFLRFGEVVGNAGVWSGLVIVLLAKAITTLTALSLSAISTNTRVRGGGAYFLISRSLGVEFGGSIGVVFFVAQATSVAMYVIGFTEALVAAFPAAELSPGLVATLVNIVVFACVFGGAGWAIKVQYAILALLGLALGSFFVGVWVGASWEQLSENLAPDYGIGKDFFVMFALFFPAATGIMAGANMSGDLKKPGRAIPLGTLASIGVTAVI